MSVLGDGNTFTGGVPPVRPSRLDRLDRLGAALGWSGVGLGSSEIGWPRAVMRLTGVKDTATNRMISRVLGAREITTGVGVLGSDRPGGWLWGRVGGDAVDLSVLAIGAYRHRDERWRLTRLMFAAGAVAGVTVLDVLAARRHPGAPALTRRPVHTRSSTTIRRSPEELYRKWHDFEALPSFMYHLDSVRTTDGRSHWRARGPAGMRVEWDAEIVEDRPDELISWQSVEGSDVRNAGTVRFVPAPGGRGTEVHVELDYEAPAGTPGIAAARLFGEEPSQQIADDLRRFKQLMETGEVVRSESSPAGARSAVHHLRERPAQPLG